MNLGSFNRTEALGTKDAAHVPVVVSVCHSDIKRGSSVKFDPPNTYVFPCDDESRRHGVVDPFYPADVIPAGTRVLVLVDPKLVGDVRHAFDISGVQFHHHEAVTIAPEEEEDEDEFCAGSC